jgi:hypothetical protein
VNGVPGTDIDVGPSKDPETWMAATYLVPPYRRKEGALLRIVFTKGALDSAPTVTTIDTGPDVSSSGVRTFIWFELT